ncbi:MAG TPA: PLP-dependent aspartate aminotransferase family protein [Thermoplasmata archaeon]
MRFATKTIHAGQEPEPTTGAVTPPIYMTSTYSQREQSELTYARGQNPTRARLQENLAALEDAKHALAFSSGMGAITTALTLLKKGDHVIVTDDCYGGVYRIFTRFMSAYGIESTFMDLRDLVDVEDSFRPETRMLWMESPTNPLMKVADLRELAVITKAHDALSVCDNTFASPALQNPLKLGVDLVVHSMTKYLGGHADVLGGALVMNREDLFDRLRFAQNALGAVPSPFDAWLILRGIKTLSVRMEKHCDNAERLAAFLKAHSAVAKVHYPGLPDDPGHAVAKKQMRRFGGMLSFEVQDPKGLMDRLKRLEVIILAESLGGVESLIEVPATMTHKSVPVEQQKKQGITEGLVRFSVGIEDAEDLIDDIRRALS